MQTGQDAADKSKARRARSQRRKIKADGKKKPRILARGKVLRINASTQEKYLASIMPLVERMIAEARKEIQKLFAEDFAQQHFAHSVGMDASISSQIRILTNALKKKYDQLFAQTSTDAATSMADAVNRNSFNSSKASIKDFPDLKEEGKKLTIDLKSLDGRTKEILSGSAKNATSFIRSIPSKYLDRVTDEVFKSVTQGNGMEDLIPFFEKFDEGTKNWVHNTAMDQTRKLYNGLNKGRMQKIGVTQAEWIHSGGSQHPRPLHEAFDGQIYDLDKGAPVGDDDDNEYVDAGEEPNCRCTFAPVIADDELNAGEKEDDEGEDEE
jgi:uncharacterized protein with gpF-like domain